MVKACDGYKAAQVALWISYAKYLHIVEQVILLDYTKWSFEKVDLNKTFKFVLEVFSSYIISKVSVGCLSLH